MFKRFVSGCLHSSLRWSGTGMVVLLMMSACRPDIPSDVIPPSEMERILYDYHLAQGMADSEGDSIDARKYMYVQAVFKKYGITKAEFDSSMVWYSANTSYLYDIYQKLETRYEAELKTFNTGGQGDYTANLSAQGDTANIWVDKVTRLLKPEKMADRLQFSIAADSSIYPGDAFLWRFDSRYIGSGNDVEAYAAFYVRLKNDSVIATSQRIYSSRQLQLTLETDTTDTVRSINGFVYIKRRRAQNDFVMLMLDQIRLIRFHRHFEPAPVAVKDTVNRQSADTAKTKKDSVPFVPVHQERRLSPTELRDSRPVERSINVVKEKPYRVVRPIRRNGNRR